MLGHDLHPEVVDFMLQTLILIVKTDESDVAFPDGPDAQGRPVNQLLHWSERIENRRPDETGIYPMAAL